MLTTPSPKFQLLLVIFPVDRFVNWMGLPTCTVAALAVKDATGGGTLGLCATICRVTIDEPPGPVTVKITLYVPTLLNVCSGLRSVEVVPSPKFHRYDVMLPAD